MMPEDTNASDDKTGNDATNEKLDETKIEGLEKEIYAQKKKLDICITELEVAKGKKLEGVIESFVSEVKERAVELENRDSTHYKNLSNVQQEIDEIKKNPQYGYKDYENIKKQVIDLNREVEIVKETHSQKILDQKEFWKTVHIILILIGVVVSLLLIVLIVYLFKP